MILRDEKASLPGASIRRAYVVNIADTAKKKDT